MTQSASSIRICDFLEKAENYWPQKPSVSFGNHSYTWQQTAQRCKALASVMLAQGVSAGDRVVYLGFNSHRCFESYYAPALIGAIMIPLNHRLSLRELIDCVDDASPVLLLVDASFLEQARTLKEACNSIKTLLYADEGVVPEDMICYEQSILEQGVVQLSDLAPSKNEDTAMIFYTGGTTGRSKGVMMSNTNLFANAVGTIPLYKLVEGETFLIAGPMFHLASGARVFTVAVTGGHAVILPRFDAGAVLQTIEKYRVNSITMVPTMFQLLLDHPQFKQADLSSLRMVTYGAAPMSMTLLQRIMDGFAGAELYQSFGMTETAPVVTTLDCTYHTCDPKNREKLGSVGRPVPYVDVRVVDDNDLQVPTGATGEIVVRGPNVMQGYWQLPEQTAQALRGGWYHTGDGGYFDNEGFLYLAGRVKDMIVSGGENVYPIEVENILAEHPAVHQCAVIGIPHAIWGEAVHAVISLKPNATVDEEELIAFCKDRIAHYKCPVSVSIHTEPLPLSAVNKILKSELRKPFWENQSEGES